MITTYKQRALRWVDIENPNSDDVKELLRDYPVHPLIAEELLEPSLRPKVDIYKDVVYLIFHFPVFNSSKKEFDMLELDFILGNNFIITAHYNTISPIVELSKLFESKILVKENGITKPHTVFFRIMKAMYEFVTYRLDYIHISIKEVENEIFEKRSENYNLVRKISHIRNDILNFRRALQPHRGILESLTYDGSNLLGKDFHMYHSHLIGEHFRLASILESDKEAIETIQTTHDSLLSNRTNDIMKVLTIMAFATFPLMLITGMFGMNTRYLPIVGIRGDFWIIVSIMILSTVGFFIFFRRRKWL